MEIKKKYDGFQTSSREKHIAETLARRRNFFFQMNDIEFPLELETFTDLSESFFQTSHKIISQAIQDQNWNNVQTEISKLSNVLDITDNNKLTYLKVMFETGIVALIDIICESALINQSYNLLINCILFFSKLSFGDNSSAEYLSKLKFTRNIISFYAIEDLQIKKNCLHFMMNIVGENGLFFNIFNTHEIWGLTFDVLSKNKLEDENIIDLAVCYFRNIFQNCPERLSSDNIQSILIILDFYFQQSNNYDILNECMYCFILACQKDDFFKLKFYSVFGKNSIVKLMKNFEFKKAVCVNSKKLIVIEYSSRILAYLTISDKNTIDSLVELLPIKTLKKLSNFKNNDIQQTAISILFNLCSHSYQFYEKAFVDSILDSICQLCYSKNHNLAKVAIRCLILFVENADVSKFKLLVEAYDLIDLTGNVINGLSNELSYFGVRLCNLIFDKDVKFFRGENSGTFCKFFLDKKIDEVLQNKRFCFLETSKKEQIDLLQTTLLALKSYEFERTMYSE